MYSWASDGETCLRPWDDLVKQTRVDGPRALFGGDLLVPGADAFI